MDIRSFLNIPRIKHGGYASIFSLFVLTAFLVLNLMVGHFGWQVDMTRRGVFTLSQNTRDILQTLNEDVTIYVLARRNGEDPQIMAALDLYAQASDRIRVQTVDAEQNPAFVARFDPAGTGLRNGSVIVAGANAHRSIQGIDLFSVDWRNPQSPQILGLNVENRITNALLFVAAGSTPVIYQMTGQGQIDLAQQGAQRRLGEHFQNANFELRFINLAQASHVPEDAAIVALVRPRNDITHDESEKLLTWLSEGGKLFVAMELAAGELPNLARVLGQFGIGIPSAALVDPNRNFNNGQPLELWPQLEDTSITRPLIDANFQVFTPLARPVVFLEETPRGVTIEPLLLTSTDSFFRENLEIPSPGITSEDVPGPHPVAVRAVAHEFITGQETARILVVGDVDFIALADQINGNLDFLMNSFAWLEDQEEIISIRPRLTVQFPMQTTGMQKLVFGGLFVVVIPLSVLVLGVITWLRRRHL